MDFYFRVYQRIAQDIKVPFKLENGERIDDTPVYVALREALLYLFFLGQKSYERIFKKKRYEEIFIISK